MKTYIGCAIVAGCLLFQNNFAADAEGRVRPIDVDGRFYSSDPVQLSADIDKYLAQAEDALIPTDGRLIGIVCPHDIYSHSAPVAAWSYRQLSQLKNSVDLVGDRRGEPSFVLQWRVAGKLPCVENTDRGDKCRHWVGENAFARKWLPEPQPRAAHAGALHRGAIAVHQEDLAGLRSFLFSLVT